MSIDRHRRAKEVFLAACELSGDERASYLDEECAGDDDLRREVDALLEIDCATPDSSEDRRPPERIGNFHLLQKVGEGGMGEVWEAEQEAPVRRRVAFKLIKWGMDTKEVLARFESERQALALMNHPNIAKAFEAGSTDEGRPFFAMEYVRGVPVTEYCDAQRLSTKERLTLFTAVCDGVQHAHQKGVIHRDIKPSNILVVVEDGRPAPKIIDFGVAKATSQRLTERTLFTELGQWIGTPEYMSPEQAELTGLDVDTRSDVYSLGVVLYELLAGTQPFDSKELRTAGFDEMRRRIREEEPPRPSTRVSSLGNASQTAAERRRTDIHGLTRTLRGDLDWIVMKALEKDRTRRYGSPSELAADVDRYLRNELVEASPPSTAYRVRKFARRHKVGVAAGFLVTAALVVGVTGTTIGLVRARSEAETARKVSELLAAVFADLDPGTQMGQIPSTGAMLDRGVDRIRDELSDQPVLWARLLDTVGNAYRNLGRNGDARVLLEEAIELRSEHLGETSAQVGHSTVSLGWVAFSTGAFDEALGLFERAAIIYEESLGPEHRFVATSLGNAGNVYWRTGKYDEAREAFDRSLEILAAIGMENDPIVVNTTWPQAIMLMDLGRHLEAQPLLENALRLFEQQFGPDHPVVAGLCGALGRCYLETLRLGEARQYSQRALDIIQNTLGTEHPNLVWPLMNLADISHRQGDDEASDEGFQRALRIAELSLGKDQPDHYLEHIQGAKEAVSIPIIASINGTSAGGWTRYAKKMEEAGADALELNTYYIATDANEPGSDVEKRTLDIVAAVKEAVSIPIAVKLSPFFSSLANFAKQLQEKGADGLVIFNRFYQPDLDIEELDVVPNLRLSTADELRLRLRWLAILSSQVELSLAATGGAHNAVDVIKATMAGAHSVQMVSALLIHGPEHIKRTLEAVDFWLTEHEYESLRQMQGSMNMSKVPNAAKLTRANYMKMLDSWQQ